MRAPGRLTGVLITAGAVAAGAVLLRGRLRARRTAWTAGIDAADDRDGVLAAGAEGAEEPAWIRIDSFQDPLVAAGVASGPGPITAGAPAITL